MWERAAQERKETQKLLLPAKAVNIFPRTYGADAPISDQQYRMNRKKGDIPPKNKMQPVSRLPKDRDANSAKK